MSLTFPVNPEKQKLLEQQMQQLHIVEKDLLEKFFSSATKGGQKANKSATGVFLQHLPSGIEVKCSVYRTQGLNRYKARKILCDKIKNMSKSGKNEQKEIAEKIRKQKNRRKRRNKKNKKVDFTLKYR